MKRAFLCCALLLCFSHFLGAQNEPVQSPLMIGEKQLEAKLYTSIYSKTQTDGFDLANSRSTFLTSFLQFLYGDSPTLNLGLDVVFKSNVLGDDLSESPFKSLSFSDFDGFLFNERGDTLRRRDGIPVRTEARAGIAHIGPKVRILPISSLPRLIFQQTIYFPLNRSVDGRTISVSQLAYAARLSEGLDLYAEISVWLPRELSSQQFLFVKLFPSYKLTNGIYVFGQFTLPFEAGGGIKVYPFGQFEIELSYTKLFSIDPFISQEDNPRTFNFGVRTLFGSNN